LALGQPDLGEQPSEQFAQVEVGQSGGEGGENARISQKFGGPDFHRLRKNAVFSALVFRGCFFVAPWLSRFSFSPAISLPGFGYFPGNAGHS
jgi:hypothetical protein